MDRAIIYLFSNSSWMYACEYHLTTHAYLGKPKEIIIGRGWSTREIDEMVTTYWEENVQIFE